MSVPVNVMQLASATYTADGNTNWFPSSVLDSLNVDAIVSDIRGASPSLQFFLEGQDTDGNAYTLYEPSAITADGNFSQSLGAGLQSDVVVPPYVRLRWTLTTNPIATTVTTGANSATQTVGATAGMRVGDSLFFATANVHATIQSITSGTVVVLTTTVNSTTSEAVTVDGTPNAVFSASMFGK